MKHTIAQMIDLLTIQNLKIWHAENIKRDPDATDAEVANAARITNTTNSLRNDLISAIDEQINELIISGKPQKLYKVNKMYGKK